MVNHNLEKPKKEIRFRTVDGRTEVIGFPREERGKENGTQDELPLVRNINGQSTNSKKARRSQAEEGALLKRATLGQPRALVEAKQEPAVLVTWVG